MFHTDIEALLLLEKYMYHLHPYQHATTVILPLITFIFPFYFECVVSSSHVARLPTPTPTPT